MDYGGLTRVDLYKNKPYCVNLIESRDIRSTFQYRRVCVNVLKATTHKARFSRLLIMIACYTTGSAANWRQVTQSSQLRDVEWTTHNCTLSFTVCGQSVLSYLDVCLSVCHTSHFALFTGNNIIFVIYFAHRYEIYS